MSQSVILLWERRRVCGLIAEADAARLQVQRRFALDWPAEFDPLQSPVQAAEQLRKLCNAQAAAPLRAIVCLSREDVILRHLEVPDVPEDELPDLVRFQAASRSTLPLDQLLLDFLPLPKHAGGEGRSVLAVTVAKPLVHGIQSILRAAGLEPAAVTFSSIGLAEITAHVELQRGQAASRAVVSLVRLPSRMELVVLSANRLLYAHSARLPGAESDAAMPGLLAEVSRTIVAAQRLHPHLAIQQAYVAAAGDDVPQLIAALSERLGAPVEPMQPTNVAGLTVSPDSLPEEDALSPVLLGAALAESNPLCLPFDFLHPRQPPPKVNLTKLRVMVGAAAALLLAALGASGFEWARSSLERRILSLHKQQEDLDLQLKAGKAALDAAGLIERWQAGNVNQWQQMAALEGLMLGTDRMYLSNYNFTAGQGETLGNLQALGNARTRDDVPEFHQRLMESKRYRINPRQLAQSGRDEEYPVRFELNADLLPKAAATVPPAASPKPATPP